jgi:hypothetical protein
MTSATPISERLLTHGLLDHNSPIPLYYQLANALQRFIHMNPDLGETLLLALRRYSTA